jgi:hypothetical protein
MAVRAADARETFLQIAALEKGGHAAVDHRPPEAVLGLKLLVVGLLEGVKMLVDQAPQIGGLRIAWTVQRGRFGTWHNHEDNALSRAAVDSRGTHTSPSMAEQPFASTRKCTRPHLYTCTLLDNQRLPIIHAWAQIIGLTMVTSHISLPEAVSKRGKLVGSDTSRLGPIKPGPAAS